MAQNRVAIVALASLTSAQDAVRAGAGLNMDTVEAGLLVVDTTITIVSGIVCTVAIQGSVDGVTYVALKTPENPAIVTVSATATLALAIPLAAYAFQWFRVTMTFSGAATAGGDLTAATYRYVPRGKYLGNGG